MARKYLVPIDLTKQELQNARIQNLSSAPASPVAGQIYFDTSDSTLYFYDGSAWVDTQSTSSTPIAHGVLSSRPSASSSGADTLYYATDNGLLYLSDGSTWSQVSQFGSSQSTTIAMGGSAADGSSTKYARADHSHGAPSFGSVTAQTSFGASSGNGSATTPARSDHTHGTPAHNAAAHSGISISDLSAPTGSVAWGGYKITGLADPTSAQDASTKAYVDNAVAGLSWKEAVNLLAASNIALTGTSGTLVIDGHTALSSLNDGYRILLTGQTTSANNGIYTYSDAGSGYTLSRSSDADAYGELIGASVFVSEGTAYGSTAWIQTNHYLTSFSSQQWVQFSGAGTYTASDGVVLTGNDFSFDPDTNGGLETGPNGGAIKLPTNSGLVTDSTGLYVSAGTGITVSGSTVAVDTSVVARKYATTIGDGSTTSFTVTHSLGTRDVTVQVYTVSDYTQVETDVAHSTTNTVTVAFASAPTSNQYRVVVIG